MSRGDGQGTHRARDRRIGRHRRRACARLRRQGFRSGPDRPPRRTARRAGRRAHTACTDVRVRSHAGRSGAARDPLALVAALERDGVAVDALVNNAGFAVPGRYRDTSWEVQRDFLQVLVTAPCELIQRLLPGMTQRGYGRILNVASVAGLMPGSASHTLYGGAKAMLIKLSQSLHSEQKGTGVHVTALCPGFTYSEFHDVTGTREEMRRLPQMMWLSADRVAREGYDAVMKNRAVCVPGAQYKTIVALARLLPLGAGHHVAAAAFAHPGKAQVADPSPLHDNPILPPCPLRDRHNNNRYRTRGFRGCLRSRSLPRLHIGVIRRRCRPGVATLSLGISQRNHLPGHAAPGVSDGRQSRLGRQPCDCIPGRQSYTLARAVHAARDEAASPHSFKNEEGQMSSTRSEICAARCHRHPCRCRRRASTDRHRARRCVGREMDPRPREVEIHARPGALQRV